jgi:hypothetical protein
MSPTSGEIRIFKEVRRVEGVVALGEEKECPPILVGHSLGLLLQ